MEIKLTSIFKVLLGGILSIFVVIFFWICSRFTVDDAFISWRYGKNLVESGVWNYNPIAFDLTQAYTNPIYAILSIIPSYLNIDVVLFFKIISILIIILFSAWFYKQSSNFLLLLLFYASPITMIHAFSGLETFLFVVLNTALIIYLYKDRVIASALISCLLFLTRPESWILLVLVPTYFLFKGKSLKEFYNHKNSEDNFASKVESLSLSVSLKILVVLSTILFAYLLFHKLHFGYALPNTFYIKSASAFNIFTFVKYSLFLSPLLILLLYKKYKIFLFMVLYFGAFVVTYAGSSLTMGYDARFLFHIFSPIYLFIIYFSHIITKNELPIKSKFYIPFQSVLLSRKVVPIIAISYLLLITLYFVIPSSIIHRANYYPRLLNSHAELGNVLNEISKERELKSFAFIDAGIAAYNSNLLALDPYGLGSSIVAHEGVSYELLNRYDLDIIVFHSRPKTGIRFDAPNYDLIYDWSQKNNFQEICEMYFNDFTSFKIFSDKELKELYPLCIESKAKNSIPNNEFWDKHWKKPPFTYWKVKN